MNVLLVTLAVAATVLFLAIWFSFFWHYGQRKAAEWFPQKPVVAQSKPELRLVK